MPKLWSFGDSFTYGEGVKYTDTFSYQIASKLNLDPIILGSRGASNSDIEGAIEHYSRNFKKNDLILINWSTPHRDSKDMNDYYNKRREYGNLKFKPTKFLEQLVRVDKLLKPFNFFMTQAFNPIFGYDYDVDSKYKFERYIEWGKPNNTLVDIITDNWLKDNQKHFFMSLYPVPFIDENFADDKKHPSRIGHELIANKLLEYIK